jgi:hypothetical protein
VAVKYVICSKLSVQGPGHPQPTVQWVPSLIPGADHVVDRSRLSSAEVENEWSYTFAPPVHLRGVGRDEFNFLACFLPEKSIRMVPTLEITVGIRMVAYGIFVHNLNSQTTNFLVQSSSKMLTHSIFCSCVQIRKHVILAGLATSVSVPNELVYATYPSFSDETFSERECLIHSVWHIH